MAFECVACHRPIINRRIAICQFCGAEIPPHLLFDQRTIAKLAALGAAETKKHGEWMASYDRKPEGFDPGMDATSGI